MSDPEEISEGRRKVLMEKSAELRAEWMRAERAEAEVERLRAALKWLVDKYDEAIPLRTADFHIPDCACMRCARDNARAALSNRLACVKLVIDCEEGEGL